MRTIIANQNGTMPAKISLIGTSETNGVTMKTLMPSRRIDQAHFQHDHRGEAPNQIGS